MEKSRQAKEHRVEWPRVAAEIAAYEMRTLPVAPTRTNEKRQLAVGWSIIHAEVRRRTHTRRGAEDVRIAHGHNDNVASVQTNRWNGAVQNFRPASARSDCMEHDHMLSFRHDLAGYGGACRGFGNPGCTLLDVKKDRTG